MVTCSSQHASNPITPDHQQRALHLASPQFASLQHACSMHSVINAHSDTQRHQQADLSLPSLSYNSQRAQTHVGPALANTVWLWAYRTKDAIYMVENDPEIGGGMKCCYRATMWVGGAHALQPRRQEAAAEHQRWGCHCSRSRLCHRL